MYKNILFLFLIALLFSSCQVGNQTHLTTPIVDNEYNIIPLPSSLTPKEGAFQLNNNTMIVNKTGELGQAIAENLQHRITTSTGYTLALKNEGDKENVIVFEVDESSFNPEAYQLSVRSWRWMLRITCMI